MWADSTPSDDPVEEDTLDVDIFAQWLERSSHEAYLQNHDEHLQRRRDARNPERKKTEQNAVQKEQDGQDLYEMFANGLISRLLKNNIFTAAALNREVASWEDRTQNPMGARLVARSWIDPEFKSLLLKDVNAAIQRMTDGAESAATLMPEHSHDHSEHDNDPEHDHQHDHHACYKTPPPHPDSKLARHHGERLLLALENTPTVHNVVVCTLCSCYPLGILGYSPAWYKSREYRARIVREPRRVLTEEFGMTLPKSVLQVRVHDSLADCRYLVVPMPPPSLQGLNAQELLERVGGEEALIKMVSRDSMIGVEVLE